MKIESILDQKDELIKKVEFQDSNPQWQTVFQVRKTSPYTTRPTMHFLKMRFIYIFEDFCMNRKHQIDKRS